MWNFRNHQNLTVDIQWHKKRLIVLKGKSAMICKLATMD